MNERVKRMDANSREALKFLLLDGNSTDHFALTELNRRGFAASYASILPGLQNTSNLVQKVSDQPTPQRGMEAYETRWEIKPEFRPLVRRYFEEEV